MNIPWQDAVAISMVAVACAYVGFRVWTIARRKRTGGCGGGSCSGCEDTDKAVNKKAQRFVSVDELKRSRKTK